MVAGQGCKIKKKVFDISRILHPFFMYMVKLEFYIDLKMIGIHDRNVAYTQIV